MTRLWAILGLFFVLFVPGRARAGEDASRATFALIIGSNQSVDANLAPLRYADDDAARYLDLFRLLGARTYLLTRLDENTRALHPQAAAEAQDPRKANYDAAVQQLIADVTQASQRGVETLVYFVYAGHGNVQNGTGYVTLEDLRISGSDLARLFERVPATRIHVIADACGSYFLAYGRGPGGERRPLSEGFSLGPALLSDARIGLLLSTSSARESHEWEAFQAGVFSHEVRSGLYGAADADGDGQVSYREIASFVARANAKVPNERFRPDIHARAPRGDDTLLDIRRARGRRLEIDGKHAGHYFLEDARGVRLADLHNALGQSVSLVRPAPAGRVFLRRVDDGKEFTIDPAPEVVKIAALDPREPRTAIRGAAHESFFALFELPFDQEVVEEYPEPQPEAPAAAPPPVVLPRPAERPSLRKTIGIGSIIGGSAAVVAGGLFAFSAWQLDENPAGGEYHRSQVEVAQSNREIDSRMEFAAGCLISGAVLIVGGALLNLWPTRGGSR
jgi:hypothetical protein